MRVFKTVKWIIRIVFLVIVFVVFNEGCSHIGNICNEFNQSQHSDSDEERLEKSSVTSGREGRHLLTVENKKEKVNLTNDKKLPWNLILINRENAVPVEYDLELKLLRNDFYVDERIYPKLQEMFDDAREEGIYPLIVSAYRTKEDQEKLFKDRLDEYILEGYSSKEANTLTKEWVAIPGTSEHQIGIAVDINAELNRSTDEEVYAWLGKNSYKYGFILRYPENKKALTNVNYEPWHYRFVGVEAAGVMFEEGICLEEYIKTMK